jgi:hypothetical protein
MQIGDKVKFKQNYTTASGIVISTRAIGEVKLVHNEGTAALPEFVSVHFECCGIIFPITEVSKGFEKVEQN